MASTPRHVSGRHSSASHSHQHHSSFKPEMHPSGVVSGPNSRANSRQHRHHHHHHHHHRRNREHQAESSGHHGGISFVVEKPRKYIMESEMEIADEELILGDRPISKLSKRSHHHHHQCGHHKKPLDDEVLMDIIEAPSDVEDSEDSDQHPGKSHKKTNTPQVPSMILIPATSTIAPIRELPSLKHQSHCPMSYLPGQGDHALFTPPSSTSGTDSSLRIIRGQSKCTERKWFISVSLAMIITLVIASAGIYFGYQFLKAHLPLSDMDKENVFKGEFVVIRGDFIPVASDGQGLTFVPTEKSQFYQLKLDQILSSSPLSSSFLFNEILLLEGLEGSKGVRVHFNVHMSPQYRNVTSDDIYDILKRHIEAKNPTESFLAEVEIDVNSLHIEERSPKVPPVAPGPSTSEPPTPQSPHLHHHSDTSLINFARKDDSLHTGGRCMPFTISYCQDLPYNYTIFPNALGHQTAQEAAPILQSFKNIIDSKCHSLSYEFLCQLLQPVCYLDKKVLPCRDFCQEFKDSCLSVLPMDVKDMLDCQEFFTESDGPGACISKPGCVTELRNNGKTSLICDGVVDCPDFSDELYCPYCPENHFHCGVSKTCIAKEKLCDGVKDCSNSADERGCLSLAPNMDFASYVHQYYPSGYLIYQSSGIVGKVCADNMNNSVAIKTLDRVLTKLGESTCSLLEYQSLVSIDIVRDDHEQEDDNSESTKYVDMVSPMSRDKSFINAPCVQKNVVNITCDHLVCGRRPAFVDSSDTGVRTNLINKDFALHGDWPWLVALYKNGLHVCDGTLIDEQFIITTASCFQGQERAKWTARFASVRLQSRAPWEQKRTIIGMVKSPVEGNSIVILKMEEPIVFSDFARPICIPDNDESLIKANSSNLCVTLGWTLEGEELTQVSIRPTNQNVCEEMSEVSANTICTEEDTEPGIPCIGEEFAGAPLLCQHRDHWYLTGVLAWRKGCSTVGQRPRLYDRVAVTSDWANKVMLKLNDNKSQRIPRRQNQK